MRHTKKQESMAQILGKKQPIETILEEAQMLNLLDKYFKSAIINLFKELKIMSEKLKYENNALLNKEGQ